MRTIERQKRISRNDLRTRSNVYFLFGDNLLGIGMGGQAGAMRGEPNAIGVPTKMAPGMAYSDFFSDVDFEDNCKAIDSALARIPAGTTVVIPQDGLGIGLAELPTRAPRTFEYLNRRLAALVDDSGVPKSLVLRTCKADLTSRGGFRWPAAGYVEAPDWNPIAECGNGLHGLLWGEGNGELVSWEQDAKWLVVEVETSVIVPIGPDKVKFPRGVVVHCGDRKSATEYLAAHGGAGRAIVGGTATAGDSGTATAGDRGTATAGDSGTLLLKWWDESSGRYRVAVGYVGENGIEPNTKYRVEGKGKLVKAVKP
jgi:hypothetical protein